MISSRRHSKQVSLPASQRTLDHELYRVRRQEQYLRFTRLWQRLSYAVAVLSQFADAVTPEQCDELLTIFQQTQQAVQGVLSAFEEPDLAYGARPYSMLLRLWPFHRLTVEAQVAVRGVRGLCERGRLLSDWTGSYWQLRDVLRSIVRNYREVLGALAVEVVHPDALTSFSQPCSQYAMMA